MNNEDTEFLNFLKDNLEKGISHTPKSLADLEVVAQSEYKKQKSRRIKMRLRLITASAASIATILASALFIRPLQDTSAKSESIILAIKLLDYTDSLASDSDTSMTADELLLAWQDAPYFKIVNDLLSY